MSKGVRIPKSEVFSGYRVGVYEWVVIVGGRVLHHLPDRPQEARKTVRHRVPRPPTVIPVGERLTEDVQSVFVTS